MMIMDSATAATPAAYYDSPSAQSEFHRQPTSQAKSQSRSERAFLEYERWLEATGAPRGKVCDDTLEAYVKYQSTRYAATTIKVRFAHLKQAFAERELLSCAGSLKKTSLLVNRLVRDHNLKRKSLKEAKDLSEAQLVQYLAMRDPFLDEEEALQVRLVLHLRIKAGLFMEEIHALTTSDVEVVPEGVLVTDRAPGQPPKRLLVERAPPGTPPTLCPRETTMALLRRMPPRNGTGAAPLRLFLRYNIEGFSDTPRGRNWFSKIGEHVARALNLPDPESYGGGFGLRTIAAKRAARKTAQQAAEKATAWAAKQAQREMCQETAEASDDWYAFPTAIATPAPLFLEGVPAKAQTPLSVDDWVRFDFAAFL